METQPNELTPNQIVALEALLTCPTQQAAAKKAGVDVSTLRRWLKESEFAAAYQSARQGLIDATLNGLQAVAQKAVETLEAVLDDTTARPAERISAARAILDFALKGHDAIETEKRLAAIEEAFELLKGAKK